MAGDGTGVYFGRSIPRVFALEFLPAKIMPGYGGGILAGYFLAVLAILSGAKVATAILVLGVPMIDAIYSILRRIMAGKSPVWGDRGHLHHKLMDLGWGKRRIAIAYWLFSGILGWVALQLNSQGKMYTILVLGILIGGNFIMVKYGYLLLKEARPRQSLKNISLFVGLVFSGWLFIPEKFWTVVAAWVIFSIMTSSVYIFNDIVDVEADRKHPFKKFRPIASRQFTNPLALFVSLSGVLISLVLGGMLSYFLFFTMILYLLLQVIYTNYLKTQPIIDVMAIALGFILEFTAGVYHRGAY